MFTNECLLPTLLLLLLLPMLLLLPRLLWRAAAAVIRLECENRQYRNKAPRQSCLCRGDGVLLAFLVVLPGQLEEQRLP